MNDLQAEKLASVRTYVGPISRRIDSKLLDAFCFPPNHCAMLVSHLEREREKKNTRKEMKDERGCWVALVVSIFQEDERASLERKMEWNKCGL